MGLFSFITKLFGRVGTKVSGHIKSIGQKIATHKANLGAKLNTLKFKPRDVGPSQGYSGTGKEAVGAVGKETGIIKGGRVKLIGKDLQAKGINPRDLRDPKFDPKSVIIPKKAPPLGEITDTGGRLRTRNRG